MNSIIGLGKYLFAIPFAIFGIMHFMNADSMAAMAPIGGAIMVYIVGAAQLAAAISIIIGKYDKLAAALLGLMLLLFIIPHAMGMGIAEDAMALAHGYANAEMAQQMNMVAIMKNLIMAGGAWIYASSAAKDDAVIG